MSNGKKIFTQRHCEGCGCTFSPEICKMGLKYCCPDCLYEKTGKTADNCEKCGDDFLKEFTKTFIGCSEDCDKELGVYWLMRIGNRLNEDETGAHDLIISRIVGSMQ